MDRLRGIQGNSRGKGRTEEESPGMGEEIEELSPQDQAGSTEGSCTGSQGQLPTQGKSDLLQHEEGIKAAGQGWRRVQRQ
jgi:hypothetical protein